MKKRVSHLICDLDNTLYDWVGYFVPSFYAMADKIVELIDCDRDRLLDDFRSVHIERSDSEHSFAALEVDIIKEHFRSFTPAQIAEQIDPALHAFNSSRKSLLHTYEGVRSTLQQMQNSGIRIVAHSEAKFHAVVDRLSRLNLWQFFDKVYCRERSESSHPFPLRAKAVATEFDLHKVRELSHHQRKPSVDVLLEICDREGAAINLTAYVGDSIAKDMAMAKAAGVYAIWAKYGTAFDPSYFEQLVRISHWSPEEVIREKALRERAARVVPDATLEHSFSELVSLLEARG
jgi:FMN phosphatase YigB (HAD superfamily)